MRCYFFGLFCQFRSSNVIVCFGEWNIYIFGDKKYYFITRTLLLTFQSNCLIVLTHKGQRPDYGGTRVILNETESIASPAPPLTGCYRCYSAHYFVTSASGIIRDVTLLDVPAARPRPPSVRQSGASKLSDVR